jgi:hypothetical protein
VLLAAANLLEVAEPAAERERERERKNVRNRTMHAIL